MSTLSQPSTSPPSQPPETPKTDQAKIEYDRLIAYFKLLVWITGALFGLVIAAAGILLFKSTADIQTQLIATRDAATQQIATIKTSAQDTAKSEAQKAIDAAFEKQNVQRMIESAAQKKVEAAVGDAVRKNLGARIDEFRILVNKTGEVANHGAQLRMGFRDGLDALLKEREDPDPTIRAYARSTLTQVAADYQSSAPNRQRLLPLGMPTKFLIGEIESDKGPLAPYRIAEAFDDMKQRVGWDVPMFDIPAAEKWCAQHKPKCDEDLPKP